MDFCLAKTAGQKSSESRLGETPDETRPRSKLSKKFILARSIGLAPHGNVQNAPNPQQGRASRVRGQRRSRRRNGGDSVGKYFGDAWSLAKRTAYGLNEIRKLVNVEEKVIEVDSASATFNTNGTIYSLSTIVQGTNFNERIGNSIKLQSIDVRYRIFMNTTSGNTVVRVIIFRDLDGYGTAPTVTDVLAQGVGSTTAPLAMHDFLNRKRFSYLYDYVDTLSPQGERGFATEVHIPHEGHILYLGSTAAAASNGKGSLYMLVISDESTNTPSVAFQSRVVFTDD